MLLCQLVYPTLHLNRQTQRVGATLLLTGRTEGEMVLPLPLHRAATVLSFAHRQPRWRHYAGAACSLNRISCAAAAVLPVVLAGRWCKHLRCSL